MRRQTTVLSLLAVGAAANAAVNLNINLQYQTVVAPSSGSISVMYSGTVDVLLPGWDVSGWMLESPSDGSNLLLANIDPGFAAYAAGNNPGVDYSGNLFSVTVQSTTVPGFYYLNSNNSNPLSEFIVDVSLPGAVTAVDNEMFGLTVEPVPEPATLAALGLGAVAFMRRKRK